MPQRCKRRAHGLVELAKPVASYLGRVTAGRFYALCRPSAMAQHAKQLQHGENEDHRGRVPDGDLLARASTRHELAHGSNS
jgi:hypothetical protein